MNVENINVGNRIDHAIKSIVIGFGGSALSGKSHLSEKVAQTLGWPRASFGDHVRETARARGVEVSRGTLQAIGQELIMTDIEGFCRAVLGRANWIPGQPAVLDGIRHAKALSMLQKIVAPQPFVLVLITAPDVLRNKRLAERSQGLETASIAELDGHSTEREVNTILPSLADLRVESSDGGDDRTDDVIQWLAVYLAAR